MTDDILHANPIGSEPTDQGEPEPGADILHTPNLQKAAQRALLNVPTNEDDYDARVRARTLSEALGQAIAIAKRDSGKNEGDSPKDADDKERAQADAIGAVLSGRHDYYGSMWNGRRPFKTGAEYAQHMRNIVLNGPKAALSDESRAFYEADYETQCRIAAEKEGAMDVLKRGAADALDAFRVTQPLTRAEESEADDETIRASATLAVGNMGGTDIPAERYKEAEAKVRAWREQQQKEAIRSKYESKLNRDNAWNALTTILPTLSDGAQECAKAILDSEDNALPVRYEAKFKALSERERNLLIQTRQLSADKIDSGFWNTIADAFIGAGNISSRILSAPIRQGAKFVTMARNAATDPAEAGIDVNNLAITRQQLWQVTGDPLAGGDIKTGQLPQLEFEQTCEEHGVIGDSVIGAISTLPYMGAAMIPYAGPALVALEAMQEFDDHVALSGGDITTPGYLVSSFVLGGLYAYIEKLQVENLLGGISEQGVREGLLKGFWSGIKNGTVPRVMTAQTLSESLQEGLQNGVMAINNSYALKEDAVRAFGEAFIEDFIGSLGTMAIIGAGGTVLGHMRRSGWHVRGVDGKTAALLRQEERSTDLTNIYLAEFAHQNMVKASGRSDEIQEEGRRRQESALWGFWQEGGRSGLIEKGGVSENAADNLDRLFTSIREAEGATTKADAALAEWNAGRGVKATPKSGERGDIGQQYLEQLVGSLIQGRIGEQDFIGKLVDLGFTEQGARDYATFGSLENKVLTEQKAIQSFLQGRYEREAGEAESQDLQKVQGAIRDLDRARSVWAQGLGIYRQEDDGSVSDPGAIALQKFGFAKADAERISKLFHYERAAAYSPIALDGIRAMYEKATRGKVSAKAALASEFKGRVVRMPTGTDEKGRTVYGDFIRFTHDKQTGYVQILESPTGAPDFNETDQAVAESVAEATKNFKKPVTADEWIRATPEEREKIWKDYRLSDEGYFKPVSPVKLTLASDPSATVSSKEADAILFGTITLASDAAFNGDRQTLDTIRTIDSSAGFHEAYHAWRHFMRSTGAWSKKDEAELEKKYGPGEGGHNEEAAANALRSYMTRRVQGRMTGEDEKSPFAKLFALARNLKRHADEKAIRERTAANAEEAFFDQIIVDNFTGVGDLSAQPEAPKPAESTKTSASAAPQMPGRTAKGTNNGPTEPEKKPEETAKAPEAPKPAAPAAAPKPAALRGWSAYTPTGNIKVGGHYAVVNLSDVIHSNNPAYALYMRAQLRNRKDNKAEEETRKNIVDNFQGERLLEAPDTANGAPIVFIAPDEKGTKRMFVLSGNGRILVLNELAERHLYDKYRNVMKDWAAENGLEVPEGETPVLVRVITDLGGSTLEKIADLSNTNSIQQYTEEEQARADAEVIKSLGIARLYHANANGTPDMTPGVNDDFFSEFIRGVGDSALYNSDRSLTETARIRAVRALLAIAVGQGERGRDVVKKLIEQTDTLNIARQKNAAAIMAAAVAALETNDAYSIGPDVSRAMADFIDFAEKKKAGKIGTFDEYLAQMDLLDAPSELAREILKLFGGRESAADIAEYVNTYCEAAAQSDPTGGLFGEAGVRTRTDIWHDAVKTVQDKRAKDAAKHSVASVEDPGMNQAFPERITKEEWDIVARDGGTTDRAYDIGFILPDGRMIPYTSHIGIASPLIVERGIKFNEHNGYRMVATMLENGAIRFGNIHENWMQVGAKPSAEQRDRIYDWLDEVEKNAGFGGSVTLEVRSPDGKKFYSASYTSRVSAGRLIADIDDFYDNGAIPEGQSLLSSFFSRHSITKTLDDKGFKALVDHYGTTGDFRFGGYVMPDGRMLDFSGRSEGAVNPSRRTVDHKDIFGVLEESDGTERTGLQARTDAIGSGMIRLFPEAGGIEIAVRPTEAQLDTLRDFADYHGGEVFIDFDSPDMRTIEGSAKYRKGTASGRIITDIGEFFDTGRVPAGSTDFHSFSVAGTDFEAVAKYYDGGVRDIARRLKRADQEALALAADAMARAVKPGDILIPVPSHDGQAHDTLLLAEAISERTGTPVLNALRGEIREPLYDLKLRGELPSAEDLGFRQVVSIPNGRNPVFIDNVVGTGTTALAAREALGSGHVLAFAWDHTAPRPVGIVGGLYERHAIRSEGSVLDEYETEEDRSKAKHSIFAGEKLATPKRLEGLSRAKQMLADGGGDYEANKAAIFNETGWFKGADGKWRVELPDLKRKDIEKAEPIDFADSDAIREIYGMEEYLAFNLGDLVTLPSGLKSAYNGLDWIPVFLCGEKDLERLTGDKNTTAATNVSMSRGIFGVEPHVDILIAAENKKGDLVVDGGEKRSFLTEKTMRSLTHELQHVIQLYESFAFGGNAGSGETAYGLAAGEVEARNAARRRSASARNRSPWNTEDVPLVRQRVGYSGWDWTDDGWRPMRNVDLAPAAYPKAAERHSFAIGEVGAANMPGALFTAVNLQMAREMLHGRDWAKITRPERIRIKFATGWEVGADGKWRMEEPDLPPVKMAKFRKVKVDQPNGEGLKAAASDAGDKFEPVTLGKLFPRAELFLAYPWLKSTKVALGVLDPNGTVRGSYNEDANEIRLRYSKAETPETLHSILIHEIQHAIQRIEDFARGGNRNLAQKLYMEKFKAAKQEAWPLYHEARDIAGRHLDWNERFHYFDWPKRHPEHLAALEKLRTFDDFRDWERRTSDFKKKWGHGIDYFTDSDFTAFSRAFRSAFKDYTKLAGEVEARNAAARHYKPILDLRGAYAARSDFPVLLEDTEDVERRFQKLVNGAMEEFEKIRASEDREAKHSFAGLRGQNVAGVGSIDDAEVMERRGDDRYTVWKLTGWWRGIDGNWRVELPFHGRFKFEGDFDGGMKKGYRTVSDYFEWPELYESYPELRDVEVRFEDLPDEIRGDFDPKTKTIRVNNSVRKAPSSILAKMRVAPVMIHEIQHAIQSIEHHARGGDTEEFLTWDQRKVHDEIRRLQLERELADDEETKASIDEMIEEHELALQSDAEDAERRYYTLAGEVEARNAADRFFKSPTWRLENPPWETEDVEREEQLVRYEEDEDIHWGDRATVVDGQAKYSIAASEDGNLIAVHGLSAASLSKAAKAGGLIMPSLAIVDADQGWTQPGYNDTYNPEAGANVYLIFPRETVDNPAADFFNGDALTPTIRQLQAQGIVDADGSVADLDALEAAYKDLRDSFEQVRVNYIELGMGDRMHLESARKLPTFDTTEFRNALKPILATGEPVNGMDPQSRLQLLAKLGKEVAALISRLAKKGVSEEEIQKVKALAVQDATSADDIRDFLVESGIFEGDVAELASRMFESVQEFENTAKAFIEAKEWRTVPMREALGAVVESRDPAEIERAEEILRAAGVENIRTVDTSDVVSFADNPNVRAFEEIRRRSRMVASAQRSIARRFSIQAWPENFPNVTIVTTLGHINAKYSDLHKAAKAGGLQPALDLVDQIFGPATVKGRSNPKWEKYREIAADHPNAVLVPIVAEEASGRNTLPYIFANKIREISGLPINQTVRQIVRANHTGADAFWRMTHRPEFIGNVMRGREYILVDDHVTMGGTLNELRKHIQERGGKVVGITTLTASKGSVILPIRQGTLEALAEKFGNDLGKELHEAGIANVPAELTEQEGRYLLKLSPESLRDRFARSVGERRREAADKDGPGEAGKLRSASSQGNHGRGNDGSQLHDVIPGFQDYKDPAGNLGSTRYARADIFRGRITQELDSIINDALNAQDLHGEDKLNFLQRLVERTKETKEGKIVLARYRSGDSFDGSEEQANDPKRRAVWEKIRQELLLDRITGANNEGLEAKKIRHGMSEVIAASNAAHPDLPPIAADETAAYDPLCERRLDIVIGPPAAGKSSVFVNKLSVFHRARVMDADAVKKRLPGFDNGNGASFVHEESSAVNKKLLDELLEANRGENVVLPIVGAGAKKIMRYVDMFRDRGYRIYLHNNFVPIIHAYGRALVRTTSTGRWIAPEVFFGCMDLPSAAFDEVKGKVDFWDEFTNDVPLGNDPIWVRGNYQDPAYGKIQQRTEQEGRLDRIDDPQMILDFADQMDMDERRGPFFERRPTQGSFDFGDPEGRAKHAIRSDLQENRNKAAEEALTNYITYFRLSHGGTPRANTIARMGLAMGMNVVNPKRLLDKSASRAEQVRGTLIERAAENGDVATTIALLKREDGVDESVNRLISGGITKGGELTHKGVGEINSIIGRRVEQMMRDFTAASLADMEGETGLDIAAEILEQNPDAFADEIKKSKGTDPEKPNTEDEGSDTDAPGAAPIDESQLSDYERYKRATAREEALKKVEAFIAAAKARAAENKAKAEERRKRHETVDIPGEGGGEGGDVGGEGSVKDNPYAPKNVKANFKSKEEFAAFMRVWAEHKFDETHGTTTLGKSERDKLFAEFYRITVRQELQDLADKLLAPKNADGVVIARIAKLGNGARVHVNRRLAEMEKGVRPDTIERMSAEIFGFINMAAVRVSRTDLVKEFKKTVKDKYIKGANYEDLKLDSDRRVTGWVEEAARYICRVCDLSKREINGLPSQLAAERKALHDIINRRADVYDESGKEVARAAVEDMETKKAMWKLALLDKYGAMTSLMPGEILDLQNQAIEYLDRQAADLEQLWRDTREYEEGIRRDLTGGIVAPNGQRYKEKGWLDGRLFDALNGLIRLRLQHLTRFAPENDRKKANEAINKILVMLGDGETAYNKTLQDDRRALFDGLARIFQKPKGGADNAAIKKYLNRMTEPIPAALAQQISNQGFSDSMTYGQMLQLLVSLEQRSFAEAIEHNGRQGQAELIRNFTTTDEQGRKIHVLTHEDNQFIGWLRAFYEAKRDVISPVTLRMVGQKVDSPDPLYCPVKRSMEDRVQALAEAGSTWDPIAAVFTRRIRNNRDFDEQASILGMFFDRSDETAKLLAWAERGTVIRGVFTSVGVQSAIRRAFGPGELRKIMTQILATFNGGESKKQTPGELAAVDKALNFTTYAYLGFNPLSAVKQTTSFTVWANALPGGFRDLWKYMSHFDIAALRHLKESDEYKIRYGNEVGSGQDLATKGLNENPGMNPVARMLSGAGMWMLKKGDFAPGGWIAQGLYKDRLEMHMREGLEYEAADKLAITETFNMLEETQQSGRTYNTNMLTLEHGRIGRLLTQFATSPLQQLQYETQAWRELRDMIRYNMGDRKIAAARQKLVRAAVINHLLLPAALEFVTALFKLAIGDEPPWEKDGYHWTLLTEILMGQFSRVFFIGAFSQTALNALFKREYPRMSQMLPVEGALGMAASAAITAHDVATLNAENIRKDLERAIKATAPTRIPYNIYRRMTGDSDMDRKRKKKSSGRK